MSGKINQTGAVSGVIGTITAGAVDVTGHVVTTSKSSRLNTGGHIYTTNTTATATGVTLSTPAVSGSNYNIVTWSSFGQYGTANISSHIYLYCNKNSAGMAVVATMELVRTSVHAYDFQFVSVDTAGLTAGTNIYELYIRAGGGGFYIVHDSRPYSFTVQEIEV